jgi:hypothetical protein
VQSDGDPREDALAGLALARGGEQVGEHRLPRAGKVAGNAGDGCRRVQEQRRDGNREDSRTGQTGARARLRLPPEPAATAEH